MGVDFKLKQDEFAACIRDPLHSLPPTDVAPQRMAVYQELFFNNIDGFLSSNFPVLHTLLDAQQWQDLCRSFFINHRCKTPYFSEIAEEFLAFLQNYPQADHYPFLLELAHYEWVEMALSIALYTVELADEKFMADFSLSAIAVSPLAWPLAYQYPVHQISRDFLPQETPALPTYLIVYRDQQDDVHFIQTTSVTYRLLEIIEQQPGKFANDYLGMLWQELPQFAEDMIIAEGQKIIQDMLGKGIIIPVDCA